MTETTLTAIRVGDEYAAQLAEFSDEYAEIHRLRAALDAREARLLARSAAYADALADSVVPAVFPPEGFLVGTSTSSVTGRCSPGTMKHPRGHFDRLSDREMFTGNDPVPEPVEGHSGTSTSSVTARSVAGTMRVPRGHFDKLSDRERSTRNAPVPEPVEGHSARSTASP
ncbi:hypothetical protein [Plantibacter elymi (nom. nud.)]|uniref:hypothetical protein n=1 Tax=Plantibacter elymi (nom. nud.) TaxID=199708 RepID=UPI0010557EBA|nr:hypothetical protein [Plantibacter sp. VKM Ac-1784]